MTDLALAQHHDWLMDRTRELVAAISAPQLDFNVALVSLLAALVLGGLHALSPGHGKTLVGAYLIGSRGTARHAAFLGLIVTVTHTFGVFLLGFATLYASRFMMPERLFPVLSLISALLVLGMGVVLLVQRGRAARGLWRPRPTTDGLVFVPVADSHEHDGLMHSHGGVMHSHMPPQTAGDKVTWKNLVALGISGGLVPCPSAMVLLLAAVALNKTAYGMLLVLVFSVGLAVTLTVVGLVFLFARNRMRRSGISRRWTALVPLLSAAFITLVGMALCVGVWQGFS